MIGLMNQHNDELETIVSSYVVFPSHLCGSVLSCSDLLTLCLSFISIF